MIGRISGVPAEKSPPRVMVDDKAWAQEPDVPMNTFYNLPGLGEKVRC